MLTRSMEKSRAEKRTSKQCPICRGLLQASPSDSLGAPPCLGHKVAWARDGGWELRVGGDKREMSWPKRCILRISTQGELMWREGRHPVVPHGPESTPYGTPVRAWADFCLHISTSLSMIPTRVSPKPRWLLWGVSFSCSLTYTRQTSSAIPQAPPQALALLAKGSPALSPSHLLCLQRFPVCWTLSWPHTVVVSHASLLQGREKEAHQRSRAWWAAGWGNGPAA